MQLKKLAALGATLICIWGEAHAQMWPGYSMMGPGYPVVHIGALTAYCNDPFGNPVRNFITPNSMGAMATVVGGAPAIVVDPAFSANSSWEFNVFTYVHECGHHFHGHVIGTYASYWQREHEADCYAARMTKRLGWLNDTAFNIAMMTLSTFPGSATHPPGPQRVAHAQSCR